jgi:spermidine synthase
MSDQPPVTVSSRSAGMVLVAAVFIAAICGLVYELIAGTLSSYLLGDSVTQFSLVIGFFLTAMGVGSFLSRYIERNLIAWFVLIEIAVGFIGGFAALIGFAAFAYTELYAPVLMGVVVLVGILVGLEIPIVIRVLRDLSALRVTLANVLSADYLGALVASVVFPFALLPHLGLVRAGMTTGLVNVVVGGLVLFRFREETKHWKNPLIAVACSAGLSLGAGMLFSARLVSNMETRLYQDEIVLAMDTPYQRIVITRWREDVRLYLNGHLQFATVDEYRYHEALVLPAMAAAARHDRVLILGGGDGLAARQVLRYEDVKRIDLVDLDPDVTRLFGTRPMLMALNENSLNDPRVTIHNQDAFAFVREATDAYDVILIDLPDPSVPGLSKLYSEAFFGLVGRRLADGGAMACQSTSPFRSRSTFWCIAHTAAAAKWGPDASIGLQVQPYHAEVPTFGTWGFILAARKLPEIDSLEMPAGSRYMTTELLASLFVFPPDMAELETPINQLNDPVIVQLYHAGYHKYFD